MTTTSTRRTAARSAALTSIKAIAITVAAVLAGTLVFALLGSHIIPDLTGPFAQEQYGMVVDTGSEVVQGAADHASQLGEQADSIATGTDAESGSGSADAPPPAPPPAPQPVPQPPPPTAPQQDERQQERAPEAEDDGAQQDAPPSEAAPGAEPEAEEPLERPASDEPVSGECPHRPAGWPGCPEGSTQDSGEFIASQMETRPPTDPEEIAANAAAASQGNGNGGSGPSRDEILARVNAAKNPAPRDAPPPTAVAGSVTRTIDGDTLAIGGTTLDLSLVAVFGDRHDDAVRHTRAACPVGSTASYVPDTGRAATSPDGTQRAKVWCFGPASEPATKSLNQELAELGLGGASASWQACKGSSFYKEPWAQAIGC